MDIYSETNATETLPETYELLEKIELPETHSSDSKKSSYRKPFGTRLGSVVSSL